jgi:hypothetical protein
MKSINAGRPRADPEPVEGNPTYGTSDLLRADSLELLECAALIKFPIPVFFPNSRNFIAF